jgi:hypothetical protein
MVWCVMKRRDSLICMYEFEVLMVVKMSTSVFWVTMPCGFVGSGSVLDKYTASKRLDWFFKLLFPFRFVTNSFSLHHSHAFPPRSEEW